MTSLSLNHDLATSADCEVVSFKNCFDSLELLSHWIASLGEDKGFSEKLVFELDLVLGEAVTNIIQNAYSDDQDHEITVLLHYGGDRVIVQIKDDGVFFDPLQHPEPLLPNTLEDAVEGGLGIHLIKNYVRDWAYKRQDEFNVLTLLLAEG
jgi:serine/threonine-protein kinase RsbW